MFYIKQCLGIAECRTTTRLSGCCWCYLAEQKIISYS